MKLSRLYSNRPEIFVPIVFNDGLSVILAEIHLPENRGKDTHNLGKTTTGQLIDFCLVKGRHPQFFLFKHAELFDGFTFFLELSLQDGSFLTIARSVATSSQVSILRSSTSIEDASSTAPSDWDHLNLPFERAKTLLDGIFNFTGIAPWSYRNLIGYLLRAQYDYRDVFQLGKFSGKHKTWKPFVALILGLDDEPVRALYEQRDVLDQAETRLSTLVQEWGSDDSDPSVLDGLLELRRGELAERRGALESFDFAVDDAQVTGEVVEVVERDIVELNNERYELTQLAMRLRDSLEDEKIVFRTRDAERLFHEAGVMFGDQIKHDFDQLIRFNRAIVEERRSALRDELTGCERRIAEIDEALVVRNEQRAESLEYLRESESIAKYKSLSNEVLALEASVTSLEAKRQAVSRLIELRQEVRTAGEEYGHLQTAVENEVQHDSLVPDSQFALVRRYFSQIVKRVLDQDAILAIVVNSKGGLEFSAEFVGETGLATSGDRGTSYRKLLCIAFDLAVLRSRLDQNFPRFVFHDGAFEQLEPRKRRNLLAVFREYASYGIQPVITALDSDLPDGIGAGPNDIRPEEIVLRLHDEGDQGRLFKMVSW